jgi:hypothetical protein
VNVGKVGKMDRKIVLGAQDILKELSIARRGLGVAVIGRMTVDQWRGGTSAQRDGNQGQCKNRNGIRRYSPERSDAWASKTTYRPPCRATQNTKKPHGRPLRHRDEL